MLKVLIAEDDRISSKILEKNINEWNYKAVVTKDGKEAWNILKENDITLAIIDWMMPGISGIELCRKIRKEKKHKYTYIILLTAKKNQEDINKGLLAGADDYVTKPFNRFELKARLQTGKRIIELENERNRLEKILVIRSQQDSLTSLWNKSMILRLLNEEISRSQREKHPIGVLMGDIDHFKKINDTYGHQIGDNVISEVASRLKKNIRLYDKIGRYGGDEFLIILPNCNSMNLGRVANRLHKSLIDTKINTEIGALQITISIGGASCEIVDETAPDNLIKSSDSALYKAKNKGRNSVVITKQ